LSTLLANIGVYMKQYRRQASPDNALRCDSSVQHLGHYCRENRKQQYKQRVKANAGMVGDPAEQWRDQSRARICGRHLYANDSLRVPGAEIAWGGMDYGRI